METNDELIERLARHFAHFAENEAAESSPLYAVLCRHIAADRDILRLAALAWPRRPVPNLLLGAVHYLLLGGVRHPLERFYPSVVSLAFPPQDAYPAFRDFCLEHWSAVESLVTSRLVQTNEVRRCACLLPAFGIVARAAGGRPLSLIEIGASAGLNLLWDHYAYDYGDGHRYGALEAPLLLTCDIRGNVRTPVPDTLPGVAARVGIDLHPVNVRDSDAVQWLRALIWPEQGERAVRLEQAAEIAQGDPPTLLAGDALDVLPSALAEAPSDTTLCVFHSFALNQFPREARERLFAYLSKYSEVRDVYVVSLEHHDLTDPHLDLDIYRGGVRQTRTLAHCQPHGAWMEWLERE